MKGATLPLLLILMFSHFAGAQRLNRDSLLRVVSTSKNVQERLEAARFYTWQFVFKPVDSVKYCAERLISLGTEKKYDEIISMGKSLMSYSSYVKGQIYNSLSQNIEALKLAEKVNNNYLFAYINNGFGNIYGNIDSVKAGAFYKTTLSYLEGINTPAALSLKRSALTNLGGRSNRSNQFDSAFVYLKKAEEITILMNDESQSSGNLYINLANSYLGLNQPNLALAYYRLGLESAVRFNEDRNKRLAYTNIAKYFKATGKPDSALFYLNAAVEGLDPQTISPRTLSNTYISLYESHKENKNDKDALKYLELSRLYQLKSDSTAQLQQSQALSFEEDQRQMAVATEKKKLEEERKHNLQYAAIALAVVTFVIFFFLLSHSVIANQRLIRFLGILALLIVFEFINLFIHPYLDKLTNHSIPLMLGIMVCIAALLIPLHHKLEHWITHRLVEKNKKIRLAAAKKTIAQLEKQD